MVNPEQPAIPDFFFEELIQICRTPAHDYECVYLVVAGGPVDVRVFEVCDGQEVRTDMQEESTCRPNTEGSVKWQ